VLTLFGSVACQNLDLSRVKIKGFKNRTWLRFLQVVELNFDTLNGVKTNLT